MKYLKLFEDTIKHTDPIAINHPLRDFSRKLEDIVMILQRLDNSKISTVRRYFSDNDGDRIKILYKINSQKMIIIALELRESKSEIRDIYMRVICPKIFSGFGTDSTNTNDFFKFIYATLQKYIFRDIMTGTGTDVTFKFSLDKIDDIINELKEYSIYIEASDYNL